MGSIFEIFQPFFHLKSNSCLVGIFGRLDADHPGKDFPAQFLLKLALGALL